MKETVNVKVGERELTFETGWLAKQADGAVKVQCGDTVVLVTAMAEREERTDVSFLPLTCDYREYTYAAGRIPGGFFKREGRPTEKEVLTSRMIDRPIRPLFPEGYRFETQVIAMVLSAEPDINPDVLALNGASAALYCSDVAFDTPLGAVRVGLIEDRLVLNPSLEEMETSRLDLIVVASEKAIVMVEAGADEVSEDKMLEALELAHATIREIIARIRELGQRLNITKRQVEPVVHDAEIARLVEEKGSELTREAMFTEGKLAGNARMREAKEKVLENFPEDDEARREEAKKAFNRLKEKIFRKELLENGNRPDRRSADEIRSITTEVALLPRAHGSAVFTRGETQALVTTTLGTGDDEQRMENLTGEWRKKFLLHYNFPPFSVGEVRWLRGPGRREIGHGALAERAIKPMLPNDEEFPYTIRVVSDILESNGSSSMATVCGGIMALQDAGVPIKRPVAGVAMGLVMEGEKAAILSDIAGFEDHYGDMDFKVAGSERGITALQMDIKVSGVTRQLMADALEQARKGRLHILAKMAETISEPRAEVSIYAPQITTIQIPVAKIGAVIGPGGKMIRAITEETGTKIDIEDDGTVRIASTDGEKAKQAIARIEELTAVPKVGKTYLGKVVKVVDFGAFVEILPGTEGLLHISELAERRINDIHKEVHQGDKILVKVLEIEGEKRIRLSRRAVLAEQREEQSREGVTT